MSLSAQVKICGVTRAQDAELAAELGAWAIGMILVADSPRRCSLEEAELIGALLRRRLKLCGVFVDAPLQQVAEMADRLSLDLIQLHGEEGPAYCGEVARRTGAQVCKALQVATVGNVRDVERYHVDYHLLDARSTAAPDLRGGTGQTFDWGLIAARHSPVPLILSGGLQAGNVAEAIARTRPFAVDTASGTESSPGVKDPERLRAFFEACSSTTAPQLIVGGSA